MEKLKINIDGREQTIEAEEKFAKGIYIASGSKTVKKNIQKLDIRFDDNQPDNVLQHKVTKIGNWSFLTSKADDSFLQFIFMSSASPDDLNALTEGRDESYKQLIIQAYNMSRLNMGNLGLLSDLGKRSS